MTLRRVMRIRHGIGTGAALRSPLMRTGRALREFPFITEEYLEKVIAPLRRIEPETAISTVPPGETAEVFVPVTPTPRPTLVPTATPELGAGVSADSWDGKYSALFHNPCGSCHGRTAVGGLNMATYADALKGGKSGPGIVPGNPDASSIVRIQSASGHPGQLSIDELEQLIEWILAGAPER